MTSLPPPPPPPQQPHQHLAVRAVTAFIVLTPDHSTWRTVLAHAVQKAGDIAQHLRQQHYAVQSLRLITNPFSQYLDLSSSASALQDLDRIKTQLQQFETEDFSTLLQGTRIRFSIGAADTPEAIALVPSLIRSGGDLANTCVNVNLDDNNVLDHATLQLAAQTVVELSRTTPQGQGNFNFTINFNGPTLCPYFPAGFNTREMGNSIVVGLEYPNLLVHVLEQLVAPKGSNSIVSDGPSSKQHDWARARIVLQQEIETHVRAIVNVVEGHCGRLKKGGGFRFRGIDSSPAPSKHCQSMCRVVELLGVPRFGAAGTVEACAFLTRVFKSVGQGGGDGSGGQEKVPWVSLVGFSGLMFAALEDVGLAEAAAQGQYDIQHLLTYSAVCG